MGFYFDLEDRKQLIEELESIVDKAPSILTVYEKWDIATKILSIEMKSEKIDLFFEASNNITAELSNLASEINVLRSKI